jgi:hypothetical protein
MKASGFALREMNLEREAGHGSPASGPAVKDRHRSTKPSPQRTASVCRGFTNCAMPAFRRPATTLPLHASGSKPRDGGDMTWCFASRWR